MILQHANSRVFERNYLPRYITQDTQAAYRGLEPQVELTRLASGMKRTIDTRQPMRLTLKQLAAVDQHPEVRLLFRTKNALKKRIRAEFGSVTQATKAMVYDTYRQIRKDYEKTRKAHSRAAMKALQAGFRKQQALLDIAKQLGRAGTPNPLNEDCEVVAETDPNTIAEHLSEERTAVLLALFSPSSPDINEERRRRCEAINAITTLCKQQEPSFPSRNRHQTSSCIVKQTASHTTIPEILSRECTPTQCIFCLGNVSLPQAKRRKAFRDRYTLRDHFVRIHLDRLPNDQPIRCPHPSCLELLQHKQHLRNHALQVHFTPT